MRKSNEYERYLAGLAESYNPKRYVPKGPDDHYYTQNPRPGFDAGFQDNFSKLVGYIADGGFIAGQCMSDIRRLAAGQRDAQNNVSEDLEEDIVQALQQMKALFRNLEELSQTAQQAWERIVDDHL